MRGERSAKKIEKRDMGCEKRGGGRNKRLKIRVSVFVFAYALVMAIAGRIGQFFAYFSAVVLHEAAHAFCARRRGYVLSELRLMPYGAALIGEFEGAPPSDEWRIAAVGPLFSLSLGVLGAAVWWLFPATYYLTEDFVVASLALAAVNVLPVYPLDGGRIALALLSARFDRRRVYGAMRIFGLIIGVILSILFVVSCFFGANVTLMTLSAFILFSSLIPDNRCRYVRLYALSSRREKLRRGLTVREVAISESADAATMLRLVSPDRYTEFRVIGEDGSPAGRITETELFSSDGADFCGKVGDIPALKAKNRDKTV